MPQGLVCEVQKCILHFQKKFALVGDFDRVDEAVLKTKATVALINSNILLQAKQWVYSPNKDFYFLNPNGDVFFGIEEFWKEFD